MTDVKHPFRQVVRWTGTNQAELRDALGDAFIEVQWDKALVRVANGFVVHVRQGDIVTVLVTGRVIVWANGGYESVVEALAASDPAAEASVAHDLKGGAA